MNVSKLLVVLIIFLVLDIGFLTLTGKIFFDQVIDVQRVIVTMNYSAAALAYIVMMFALYWFILSRQSATILDAAILGGVINGTFELTNAAIFKKWRVETILLDTLWGAFLWGFVTFLYVNYIRPY
jgi:uncharacterized membrane protein